MGDLARREGSAVGTDAGALYQDREEPLPQPVGLMLAADSSLMSWEFTTGCFLELYETFLEKTSPDFQLFSHWTIRAKAELPQIYKN